MPFNLAELTEYLRIATEALGRYRLRTALSVTGVVLGVAAVIAMMSVSEGAAREALAQVDALGLDNLVAQSTGGLNARGTMKRSLAAADAERAVSLVPTATLGSPVVSRYLKIGHAPQLLTGQVLGVTPAFQGILRLAVARGRFISTSDEASVARVTTIGPGLARELFGFRDPIGETITIASDYYRVVGVLREQGTDPQAGRSMGWHQINRAAFVPLPTLTGHTFAVAPNQPVDEV